MFFIPILPWNYKILRRNLVVIYNCDKRFSETFTSSLITWKVCRCHTSIFLSMFCVSGTEVKILKNLSQIFMNLFSKSSRNK